MCELPDFLFITSLHLTYPCRFILTGGEEFLNKPLSFFSRIGHCEAICPYELPSMNYHTYSPHTKQGPVVLGREKVSEEELRFREPKRSLQ